MVWDGVGIELPDLRTAPDPNHAVALWTEIIEGQLQPSQILVVTDALGQVLVVTAI
jgi:hypothetical protein